MKAFLWTIVVIWCLELIAKAHVLSTGRLSRSPRDLIIDMIAIVAMLVWAAYLLGGVA